VRYRKKGTKEYGIFHINAETKKQAQGYFKKNHGRDYKIVR